eukprot:TRINITY_DN3407_c0_g1_i5.p2 TRINITY_DN3407_c0_g1~~TRINITY_DN3407_c0_g1_i5.p2  ORF type:complete len:162 (-),score=33.50 TRINITY_DN3407_c0_g1_i5:52-537(-)
MNIHIKGGSVFAYQDQAVKHNAMTIKEMEGYPIKIIVAPDSHGSGHGCLFYDDDENTEFWEEQYHHIHMDLSNNDLDFNLDHGKESYTYNKKDNEITEIIILGAQQFANTKSAKVVDKKLSSEQTLTPKYSATEQKLTLTNTNTNYKLLANNIKKIYWRDE